jgi:hypothetical protein
MRIAALGAAFLLHAGGWDEALLVGVPVAIFALFRWFASRRGRRSEAEDEEATPPSREP